MLKLDFQLNHGFRAKLTSTNVFFFFCDFCGGGVDEFDEEFTGEGSPWISVEAPVFAIKVGHTWAQLLSMYDKIYNYFLSRSCS